MTRPKIVSPPADEPLSLEECRQHLRVQAYDEDDSDSDTVGQHPDDTLIMAMQAAAREHCENFLGLSLSTRILQIALDAWPTVCRDGTTAIELPMGPVREIVSVIAGEPVSDSDSDTSFEVAPTAYTLDDYSLPCRLVPVTSWPTSGAGTNRIQVTYLAGYGVDSDGGEPLPAALRAALLLVLGHLYEHREDSAETALASIPLGAEALMRPLRVRLGMA